MELKSTEYILVVTLIPMLSDSKSSVVAAAFNEKIIELKNQFGFQVIDLNPIIAPKGVLLPEYTIDGVHLSELAYKKWARRIKEEISK